MSDTMISVPHPDPTVLTTAQLLRELSSLREIIEARLDGSDKAVDLLNSHVTKVPTDVDRQISHLKELHDGRFSGVQQQFAERDIRAKAQEDATTVAIGAALQAQKEAAAKSEVAIAEKLNGLAALLDRSLAALGDKVSDLSSRVYRSESAFNGMALQRGETRQSFGLLLTLCTMAAAMVTIFIEIMLHKGL